MPLGTCCVYGLRISFHSQSSSSKVQNSISRFQVFGIPIFEFQGPGSRGIGGCRLQAAACSHILEDSLRGGRGGSPRLVARIAPPLEELLAIKFGYVASSWPSCAPSWPQYAILVPILSPSCIKMAPRWPNIAQESAKMSQHSIKMSQNCFPRPSKSLKNL